MVDHVHVVEVGSCSLISDVDRVFEGYVPDREGLELRISGFHATFVLVVKLAQAHSHLAAARSRCCHHHQGACGFHIVILSEAFIGIDQRHVCGIAFDEIMVIDLHLSETLQALAESHSA